VISYDPRAIAANATAARPGRPATAIVHDSDDARLVVFRLGPGEEVAPHTSPSTVILTALDGHGTFIGPEHERSVQPGTVVAYEPNELHGMRATDGQFIVLATIAPRPGSR
jgi:quercetin dioxygenase-like cupin family protein